MNEQRTCAADRATTARARPRSILAYGLAAAGLVLTLFVLV